MSENSTMNKMSVEEIKALIKTIRRDIVEMTTAAKSGHPGGSLSAVEIVTAFYFAIMNHDPKNPEWEDRDRFILSKGHASPLLYSCLAHSGYFDPEMLPNRSSEDTFYRESERREKDREP